MPRRNGNRSWMLKRNLRVPHTKSSKKNRSLSSSEVERLEVQTAMYACKMRLGQRQYLCPMCLRPLPREGLVRVGDGHHVLVHRSDLGNLPELWTPMNVRLVHHACHMERGSFNTHAVAMIVHDFGAEEVAAWLDSLSAKVRHGYDQLADLLALQVEAIRARPCAYCGHHALHTLDGPVPRDGERAICWNCWRWNKEIE